MFYRHGCVYRWLWGRVDRGLLRYSPTCRHRKWNAEARVDNNRSGRVSNYISFARNCIPYYIFSSTSRIDESNHQRGFRHPLASKQGIIGNIQWFEHNRGRQCVHNIGCKGGRVILWSFRRVIKHLGKCSYITHVTHTFSSIQIHILFNVRLCINCIATTEHGYWLENWTICLGGQFVTRNVKLLKA